MSLFSKGPNKALTPREALESRYSSARGNLLFLLIASVVNIFLLLINADIYLLFAASVPYYIVMFGMAFCGLLDVDGETAAEGAVYLDKNFLYVAVVIAIIVLTVYLLCWIFSKAHKVGWLIAALIMFSMDTLVTVVFIFIDPTNFLDVIIHGFVIFYLVSGISAHYKLKKLPPEEPAPEVTDTNTDDTQQ